MPNAVSRALAVTAGATLLLLHGVWRHRRAAKKATKTVNATATLTVARQPDEEPAQAGGVQEREGQAPASRSPRAAPRAAAPAPRSRTLTAYRKTLRATRIRPTAKGTKNKAKLRAQARRARPGGAEGQPQAAVRQAREELRRRRHPVDAADGEVDDPLQRRERHDAAHGDARAEVRAADRRRQELDAARPARSPTRPRPTAGPASRSSAAASPCRTARSSRSCRAAPSRTRSRASTCSPRSPSRWTTTRSPARRRATRTTRQARLPQGPVRAAGTFALDVDAYKSDSFVPAAAASGQILGQARDVTIGGLTIPAAQYDAADRTLKVLNTVDVRATFEGGTKTFSPELNSPWERAQQSFALEPAEHGHRQVQAPVRHPPLR